MPLCLRRSLCVTLASLSLPGIALADTGYLTWKHKSDAQAAPAPTVSSGGQDYPVPPSPYGQVGDPFARTLTWSGKGRSEAPQVQPAPQQPPAVPAPAPRPVASDAAPQPAPRPAETHPRQLANIEPLPVPQHPIPQVTAPVPVPQPKPVTVPDAALKPAPKPQPQAPAQKPQPQNPAVAAKPVPAQQPAPAAAPVQPAPPQTASTGYQVPATSKYAARIAAARAATAKQEADATPAKPAAKTPDKTDKKADSAKATVPAPSPQLATEETDHVFIPGEQYKNASDAPRLYSLHRAYGLTPDPITVDHNATGALLDTADIDAGSVEEKADKTQSDDSSAKTADAAKADTKKVTQ